MDQQKIGRIKSGMQENNLDAIILKLPENVLYASQYWPIMGQSYFIFPLEHEPVLIIPETEQRWTNGSWVKRLISYGWESLATIKSPLETAADLMREIFSEYGLTKSRVGYEGSFEHISASSQNGGVIVNYPGVPTCEMYFSTLPEAEFKDITELLYRLRAVKTHHEIALIKNVNDIADHGLEVFYESVDEGKHEYEIGVSVEKAVVETALEDGKNERVQAYAMIQSGPEQTAVAGYPYSFSSKRKLRSGDLVLIELDVCVEGYWADLTRTVVVGRASKQQKEIYITVLEAQTAAFKALREGEIASDVDASARTVIERAGYGRYFHHGLGHGIGVCLHEPLFPPPYSQIHPLSHSRFQTGNILTMEPGIYFKDFGGIRIEDDILCRRDRGEYLSNSRREIEP